MNHPANIESLKSFNALYENYSPVLYGTILQFTNSKTEAGEILGITFRDYFNECKKEQGIFINNYIALNRCLIKAILQRLNVSPSEARSVILNNARPKAVAL